MLAIIASAILGVILMMAGIMFRKSWQIQLIVWCCLSVLAGVAFYDWYQTPGGHRDFYHMLELNPYTARFNLLISLCTLVYFLLFRREIARVGRSEAEYYALLFLILCGSFLLSTYSNLLIFFLGIEILSIPQYILAGSDKENIKSNEASLKYFLMGSFGTGILLMGITLLYGATGSFDIFSPTFLAQFQHSGAISSMAVSGILLILVAIGFKVSAAPMHFWTPDVYDGTPTAFTPFMATVAKVSVFIAFIRLFHLSFGNISNHWQTALACMIVLTLLIGNLTAVFQQSVKRMLAYSSIAQAGFMLFAVFAFNPVAWSGLLMYSVAYTLASFGVFAVLIRLKDYTYEGFNGLYAAEPVMAITATICLLSLTGIPITGGFVAKYLVLNATIEQGKWMGLTVFAVLMAAISAYYYFRVIRSMYFQRGFVEIRYPANRLEKTAMILNALLVLLLGILPGLLV